MNRNMITDVDEYIESLYIENVNGTIKFIGDKEDLRLIVKHIWISKEELVEKEVRQVNSEWYRLDVRRIQDGTEIEDVCGNTMRDGDEVYIDCNAEFINFSNDTIYFIRVDNMYECVEVLSIPKAFEMDSIVGYGRDTREMDELLLNFAHFYWSELMDQEDIIERFMTNEFGNDYDRYTMDEHYKDLIDTERESIAYRLEETDMRYNEWLESDEGREYMKNECSDVCNS